MQDLQILNKKKVKEILAKFEEQWGFTSELDYAFLVNKEGKLFVANRELFEVDDSKLRINSIGLYIAEIEKEPRLSIEGSQLIGPGATKNVVELSDDLASDWMKGKDIDFETECSGFVIIKNGNDYLGSGKVKDGKILNFVPKTRRLNP